MERQSRQVCRENGSAHATLRADAVAVRIWRTSQPSWDIFGDLGPILADLDRSWHVLARLGARLALILADLRPVLGRSWPILGRSWADLGRSWAHLGPIFADLVRSWPVLARLGAVLGRSRPILGPSWGYLGPSSRQKTFISYGFYNVCASSTILTRSCAHRRRS